MLDRITRPSDMLEPPSGLSELQQKMVLAIDIMRVVIDRDLTDAETAEIAGASVDEVKAIRTAKFDGVDLHRLRAMARRLCPAD